MQRAPTWEEISYPRPNTFGLKSVPNAITQDQLAVLLHTLGLVNWVAMIQRVNNVDTSRLEISLKPMYNMDEFKRILLGTDVQIEGNRIVLDDPRPLKDYIRTPITKVLIFEAPYELPDVHILAKLQAYGTLQTNQVYSHKIRGYEILNGIKSINFKKIIKPIPTVLYVKGNKIKIKYEKQDRSPICGICRTKGHFRTECPILRTLVEEEIENPQADTDPSQMTTSQIRKLIKDREDREKARRNHEEMLRVIEEKKQQKEEDDRKKKLYYEHRKRMAEQKAKQRENDERMEDEEEESSSGYEDPNGKKKRKKSEKRKRNRQQRADKKQKDANITPRSSPLNSADDQFTDSTNTIHPNSSSIESEDDARPMVQSVEQQLENNPNNSDFQVSQSYPTPAQRQPQEDGQRTEGDDSLDALDLHQPLSNTQWSDEVEKNQ